MCTLPLNISLTKFHTVSSYFHFDLESREDYRVEAEMSFHYLVRYSSQTDGLTVRIAAGVSLLHIPGKLSRLVCIMLEPPFLFFCKDSKRLMPCFDLCICLCLPLQYSRMNAINKEKERQAFGDKNEKPHDSGGH